MTELILLGGGGHARSVLAALREQGRTVLGHLAPQPGDLGDDCPHLGDDESMDAFDPGAVLFVNGLGSVASTDSRRALHERAVRRGFRAARVVHPRAFVDPGARLGDGVQVLAGAIVNVGAVVEEGALINTGAIIEHDVVVGAHSHVSPGAVIAGGVRIGDGAHVGLGARVIQGVSVGSGSLIGAGAVVIEDVPEGAVVVGVPARAIASEKKGPA
ncbi:acetyltransferase [Microbacterium esteraromaticum]|uniref:acetyltransferase n=1 Tax=Microbacterium esteraromaticum TaxID=57043 RepID=UPI00195CACB1|nr:acetyltransferase [Microbacterium esteraromaticum]MBM7467094.1 UDP-perosamine 4-acetyltransferase [Microbacterium esteraromaticum]